jgi:VWFA-related protein
MRWYLVPLIAGVILASNGFPAANAAEAVQVRIDSIDTSAYPQLRATVTVIDSGGRPIADLPAGAFSAGADGQGVPVVNVSTGLDPAVAATVALTFDSSGSMQGAAIDQARQAGKIFVSELGSNDQVAVLTFSNAVQVVHAFTNDRAALTAAIDGIQAGGNTALYDAVVAAAQTASGGAQRRAVVLLSDGMDAGAVSKNDRATSLATAQSAGIPYFLIGLGDSIDQPYLQELANITRGQLFVAPSPAALQGLYETLGAALRSQYVVDLDAAALDPATPASLEIAINDGVRSGTGQAPLDLTAFAVVATPVPTTDVSPPVPTPAVVEPPPVTEETKGSGTPLAVPLGVAAAALGLGGSAVAVIWLRRRRRKAAEQPVVLPQPNGRVPSKPIFTENEPVFVGTGPSNPEHPEAWLEVMTADHAGRFALGEDPITVGFTGDCTVRLPNGGRPGSPEGARVRLWRREGRYMLHNLSRLEKVTIAGKPAIWAILEDGDEILLGSYRVVFHDSSAVAEEPANP